MSLGFLCKILWYIVDLLFLCNSMAQQLFIAVLFLDNVAMVLHVHVQGRG